MTLLLFGLLLLLPWYIALVPGVLLNYRIGILLHEYIHGIPCKRHRYNLWVLTIYEGLMVSFGLLELFRGTHLSHHRWLNTARDPAYHSTERTAPRATPWRMFAALEGSQHVAYLLDALRGRYPIIRRARVLGGAALSLLAVVFWVALGRWDVPLWLVAMGAYNAMVSSSLRGAVEHHAAPGTADFANEYRTVIPLFNINRHVHHHVDPKCPWYRLRFMTPRPLPASEYWLRWFRVYLSGEHVLMQPMQGKAAAAARIDESIL